MKKILLSLLAIVAIIATSCEPEAVTVEFAKNRLVLMADSPLEVEMKLSQSPAAELTIPVVISGSAIKGEEYEISAEQFVFAAGQSSAKVTITPINNLSADKEISLTIGTLAAGYQLGTNASAIVSVEKKEGIIYSFSATKADLLDTYNIELVLEGETTGEDFTVTKDMELPFLIGSKSTAVSGKNFEIEGGKNVLVVKAGTNKAIATIKAKDIEIGKEAIVEIIMDKEALGARFIEGDTPSILLTVKGILKFSSLVGTWKFKEMTEIEEWMMWAEEMEDDPQLMPIHNDNYQISFTLTDGVLKLVPGAVKGDLGNLLREAVVTYSEPVNPDIDDLKTLGKYCTEECFMWTSELIQLTYFSLDKGNRAFSADKETIGKIAVAMRFNEEGDLEFHLRDYDQPPFMFNWWGDWDTEMFGFCYVMTKVN